MMQKSSNSVQHLYQRDYFRTNAIKERKYHFGRLESSKFYYLKDLIAHFGCVNAIDFSNDGKLMVSGGDDKRVLLWNVQETLQKPEGTTPKSMEAQHSSNIFSLTFDSKNQVTFSGGNDDNVIQHDLNTGRPLNYFLHERPVYGVSVDPTNDHVFASACDDGRILIYDTRASTTNAVVLAVNVGPFHSVMFNPCESRLIATANRKDGMALWDTRKPQTVFLQYGSCENCMSIRFNKKGTKLLGLRRRLPPILYNTHSSSHVAQFDQPGYYNSCTMKSCCFAGENDEYVMSGSDDFNLYMWRIPETDSYGEWVSSAHHILIGHRSLVNQVRYNDQHCIIASSGVEKIVKFWSPFNLYSNGNEVLEEMAPDKAISRKVYTHEDYIRLVLSNGDLFMNHDYSNQSTNEDPRMMAFFDSLVQREIEGWSTDESSVAGSPPHYYNRVQRSRSNSSSSSSSSSSSDLDSSRRSTSNTPSTSTSSANSSRSTNNNNIDSSILFLTDAALEQDTIRLSDNARFILEEGLRETEDKPPATGEEAKNPIKELIAQKRDRLMRLAFTPPEKRKKKHLRRLRRRYTSDEGTSQSLSENEDGKTTSRLKYKRYRISSSEENHSVDEASTSSGIRRKRKASETETPDSGIASDTKTRFLKRNFRGKRCYRNLRIESSSDDSD